MEKKCPWSSEATPSGGVVTILMPNFGWPGGTNFRLLDSRTVQAKLFVVFIN
jgi:hypothetical protein